MTRHQTPPDGTQRPTPAQLLSLRAEDSTDAVVIYVAGEIDVYTVPILRTTLTSQLDSNTSCSALVVDLSAVEFMSCAGLRILLDVQHWATTHGSELRLASCPPFVLRLLKLIDLHAQFQTYPTVYDALPKFGAEPR